MAGQEIKGDLWDQSLGLDLLQPPIVCAGFRTLSLASVQNLGSRDPRLTKLDLDQASLPRKLTHVSKGCFSQDMIKLSLGWDTRAV
jgi:hypothetical protein